MKSGTKLGLISLLLAIGVTAYWFYLVRQVNLPEDRTLFIAAFLTAVVLGVIAFFRGISFLGAVPAVFGILIGGFLTFTITISEQIVDTGRVIQVGDRIPAFTATDGQGNAFDSSALAGQLVLIKFFRGHW